MTTALHGGPTDGCPSGETDKAIIESFNGRLRQDCLNQHWFRSLKEAQTPIKAWRDGYNRSHPRSALGYRSPAAVVQAWDDKRRANAGRFLARTG
jgi:putative transposase